MGDYGTDHVGIRRDGRQWQTFDRATDSMIGGWHATLRDAIDYAEYRESATFGYAQPCDFHGSRCPVAPALSPFTRRALARELPGKVVA